MAHAPGGTIVTWRMEARKKNAIFDDVTMNEIQPAG